MARRHVEMPRQSIHVLFTRTCSEHLRAVILYVISVLPEGDEEREIASSITNLLFLIRDILWAIPF